MSNEPQNENAQFLSAELDWLGEVIATRMDLHAQDAPSDAIIETVPPPALQEGEAPYASTIGRYSLSPAERLILILALAPHIAPHLLDPFLIRNQAINRRFTEFGGRVMEEGGGFIPTLQTAIFLLAGSDLQQRLQSLESFKSSPLSGAADLLQLDPDIGDGNALLQPLQTTPEAREWLLYGMDYQPAFSTQFPAAVLSTSYEWQDLILPRETREGIEDLLQWIRNEKTLLEEFGLRHRLPPGYRAFFSGPPGTGKTLTASLIGKVTGRDVFRVDLSKVVSKYIGETEKNLARLFDRAQRRDWILFFDEAEALFGGRGERHSTNDRVGNQMVSYLLQRIEDFPGVVILASNVGDVIDEAFTRRFQSVVQFVMPDNEERLLLWQNIFDNKPYRLADDIDLAQIADAYEVSSGQIINVLRYACLKAVERAGHMIHRQDIISGIRKELVKIGKVP